MNSLLDQYLFPTGQRLEIVQGDLTEEKVDAIVNAANQALAHGGGVDGLIARRGGPLIQQESDAWVHTHGLVAHADPVYTGAGRLPCRYVIHAVGPVWGEGDEDYKLTEAIRGSLSRADELHLSSLAMPAISTGIFGFPKERAARILYQTIFDYFAIHPESGVRLVRLVLYDHPTVEAFLSVYHDWSSNETGR